MQNEDQGGTVRRFIANRPQIVGDIERSIRQKPSKAMNRKALRNTGGYWLSSNVCNCLANERKVFLFSGGGRKNSEGFLFLRVPSAEKVHVLSSGEMD
jgi:hypothetical protein